jgi:hypothetical protein
MTMSEKFNKQDNKQANNSCFRLNVNAKTTSVANSVTHVQISTIIFSSTIPKVVRDARAAHWALTVSWRTVIKSLVNVPVNHVSMDTLVQAVKMAQLTWEITVYLVVKVRLICIEGYCRWYFEFWIFIHLLHRTRSSFEKCNCDKRIAIF